MAQDEMLETKDSEEMLECPLESAELLKLGDLVGAAYAEQEAKEAEKSVAMKAFNECLDEIDGRIKAAAKKINAKQEVRPVAVRALWDYRIGIVTVTRVDTGKVIRERPISAEERQRGLYESRRDEQ